MQLGFELMMMGMGTVFAFLIVLIFFMSIMSKIVGVIENSHNEAESGEIPENTLIAVISAVLHQHRRRD